jgi:uncharacterized protein (TIGR03663 family)
LPAARDSRLDRVAVAFGALLVLALVARLVLLGDKPVHHDESQDAYFSWLLYTRGDYAYNPILHGPLRFYLTNAMFFLFGITDQTARLAPALMGTIMVGLPYFLRRQIGSVAALAAAAILCFSPSYLYFSRFAREDIYVACITLGLLIAVFRFLEHPRPWHPSLILGLLAASFATKETTYITVFVAGTFLLALMARDVVVFRGREALRGSVVTAVRSLGPDAWIWGLVTFAGVFTLLFSTFLFHPEGLRDGVVKSLQYWLSQQPVQRGTQPWFYYLVVIPAYEWPVVILGALGVAAVVRRPTPVGAFLIWAFLLSLAVYTWAGEKMPWLTLHILLPLIFLAGIGFQAAWQRRRQLTGIAALAFAALGAMYTVHAATNLAFDHPADPAEILVYTQTSTDVPHVRDQLMAINRRVRNATGQPVRLEVDGWGGASFPWAWYLRDVPVASFPDMSRPDYVPVAQSLLIAESNQPRLLPRLGSYTGYRFRLRVWWVQDYGRAGLTQWVRWLIWRTPWNQEGTFDEWLYVRNDVPGVSIVGT